MSVSSALLLAALLAPILPWARGVGSDREPQLHPADRLPPPPLMEGIGVSELPVSTESKLARQYFNQGLRLLHCFWDFEAYRSFSEAARQDPSLAMAQWGIYQALRYGGDEFKQLKQTAARRAVELMDGVSSQEQYYLRAIRQLANPEIEDRPSAYIREMEALIDSYPDDIEAQLFLAAFLGDGYEADSRPRAGTVYAQALLRRLLDTAPDHPAVHHYWIHAVEGGSRPQEAIPSAERLPGLVPRSGHMVHMPGHAYYETGDYARARSAFLSSMKVDIAYMREQGVSPVDNWNYVHNLNYLVSACAELGRLREGLYWTRQLAELELDETRPEAEGNSEIFFQGWTAIVRLHLRRGDWKAAGAASTALLEGESIPYPSGRAWLQGISAYATGMEEAEAGAVADAQRMANRLDAILWRFPERGEGEGFYSRASRAFLEVGSLELQGMIAHLEGDLESAIALLSEATAKEAEFRNAEPPRYPRPVGETLARVYLENDLPNDAVNVYRRILERRTENGYALYGLAAALASSGLPQEAAKAYRRFLIAWEDADTDLREIATAAQWLSEWSSRVSARTSSLAGMSHR